MNKSVPIRRSFFTHEDLCRCSPLARIVLLGLEYYADKDGLLEYRSKYWQLQILPYDPCDFDSLIVELSRPGKFQTNGFVTVYGAPDAGYIQVNKFIRCPLHRTRNYRTVRDAWNAMRSAVTQEVLHRDGAVCAHCASTSNLSIDHIEPIARGGTNDLDNLQVLCRPCNSRKGARV